MSYSLYCPCDRGRLLCFDTRGVSCLTACIVHVTMADCFALIPEVFHVLQPVLSMWPWQIALLWYQRCFMSYSLYCPCGHGRLLCFDTKGVSDITAFIIHVTMADGFALIPKVFQILQPLLSMWPWQMALLWYQRCFMSYSLYCPCDHGRLLCFDTRGVSCLTACIVHVAMADGFALIPKVFQILQPLLSMWPWQMALLWYQRCFRYYSLYWPCDHGRWLCFDTKGVSDITAFIVHVIMADGFALIPKVFQILQPLLSMWPWQMALLWYQRCFSYYSLYCPCDHGRWLCFDTKGVSDWPCDHGRWLCFDTKGVSDITAFIVHVTMADGFAFIPKVFQILQPLLTMWPWQMALLWYQRCFRYYSLYCPCDHGRWLCFDTKGVSDITAFIVHVTMADGFALIPKVFQLLQPVLSMWPWQMALLWYQRCFRYYSLYWLCDHGRLLCFDTKGVSDITAFIDHVTMADGFALIPKVFHFL